LGELKEHTLLLIQFSANEETRTYVDCRDSTHALETFCRIYEDFLLNKTQATSVGKEAPTEVSYKLDDILKFVDQLFDLAALTRNDRAEGHTAHGKPWFKGKIHAHLRKLA
jgi:hypothetical protein